MKLLMFMRDALPPARVDVRVLFGRTLREHGIRTDYAGPRSHEIAVSPPCAGRQFDTGARHRPSTPWRELALLWREAPHYDAIVVRDKPLWAAALFLVASWRRLPCFYWMSFPMPLGDRVGAAGHWHGGRRVRGALAWLRGALAQRVQDGWVLGRARHVFVQSEEMLRQVAAAARLQPSRLSAVPMGIDVDSLPPAAATLERATAGSTIGYLGSLDRARQLDVLVDALALVRQRHPGATLLLVGGAPREEDVAWLKAHAASRGLADSVRFTGPLPMAFAWEEIRGAAVCVSAVPPGPLHDVSSPTKVVEYLALGLPVVANDIPDQRELMAACDAGPCVPYTAEAFARALVDTLDDLEAARARAQQARPRVLALRSYDALGRQVATTLRASLA